MAWSEKAIQAALDALPMYTLEQKKAMGRALDAAAAVDVPNIIEAATRWHDAREKLCAHYNSPQKDVPTDLLTKLGHAEHALSYIIRALKRLK